ncbi:MAG: hypothetical protein ABSF87_06960 [Xanthobacteraceae bacterium]
MDAISDALKTDVTSIDLGSLIAETMAAIETAEQGAKAEREKACDPALSPDLSKARAAVEDADAVFKGLGVG